MRERLRWQAKGKRAAREDEILAAGRDEGLTAIAKRLGIKLGFVTRVVARARKQGDPRAERMPLSFLRMAVREARLARLARIARNKAQL